MREMLLKNRVKLAEDYFKKCLLTYSAETSLIQSLLLTYSKLIKSHYTPSNIDGSLTFMLESVKKASVPVSDELFQNLAVFVRLHVSVKDQKVHLIRIA